MEDRTVLIGLDGGATKVNGWTIDYDEKKRLFSLGSYSASQSYRDITGYNARFKPIDISTQLQEWEKDSIHVTEAEFQQGKALVETCARVVEALLDQCGPAKIAIGLGMPGIKTKDKRGIAVLANGPRIINYAEQLEQKLSDLGIHLVRPLSHLGSDADYCGIGENFAREGMFREVKTAYYLGGGTGVADAMKIGGKLLPFDQCKSWMAKTWELKSEDGRSMERFTSMGGLQSVYAEIIGKEVDQLNQEGIYPLQIAEKAAMQEEAARKMIEIAVDNLSKLIFERITTLYAGSVNEIDFVSQTKAPLLKEHPYLGSLFERIIIGQRLGELFESPHGKRQVRKPLIEQLGQLIQRSERLDKRAKAHYRMIDELIVSSKLREAPVIGAGIDAFFNM